MTKYAVAWPELCSCFSSISFMRDRRCTNKPMNNKLLVAFAGALVAGAAISFAGAAPAPSFTVTATGSVVSQYMFRGLRLSDGGFQPAVEAARGDLVFGAWSN